MRGYLKAGAMHEKLARHLQGMLRRFAEAGAKQFPKPGLLRIVFMFRCARLAFERSNDESERRFWREYMTDLERSAQRYKDEKRKRMENPK